MAYNYHCDNQSGKSLSAAMISAVICFFDSKVVFFYLMLDIRTFVDLMEFANYLSRCRLECYNLVVYIFNIGKLIYYKSYLTFLV